MAKTKKETKLNHTHEFTLKIPWDDVVAEYKRLLQSVAKTTEIKGFRKGKAPLTAVEKSIDQTKLYSKALERILPRRYVEELKARALKIASDPHISVKSMKQGEDWEFTFQVAKPPEVKLGEYKTYIKKALSTIKPKKQTKNPKDSKQDQDDPRTKVLFDTLLEKSEVKLSPLQIDQETNSALDNLTHQLAHMNMKIDDYLKSIKKSQDDLIKEYQTVSENKLKLHYALEEITEKEKLTVEPSELKPFKPKKGDEKYLILQLKRQKTIDKLLEL